jgi:hypothetical protein
MHKTLLIFSFFMAVFMISQSCTDHDLNNMRTDTQTDEIIFNEINQLIDFSYYQNGNTLSPASASPHGTFKLRFNQIAWTSLDDNGELPKGSSFPDGAVIVKEVYNGNNLGVYAVMKKARSERKAGERWLWAEYTPDGNVLFSIEQRGNGCISCHSDGSHRDLLRTFDLH